MPPPVFSPNGPPFLNYFPLGQKDLLHLQLFGGELLKPLRIIDRNGDPDPIYVNRIDTKKIFFLIILAHHMSTIGTNPGEICRFRFKWTFIIVRSIP